jgi:inorganic triphosphatase YgiF
VSGSREIELKFLCAPGDLGAVLAAAPAGDDDDSRELISVYFDTPDLTLQKQGVSLRVRESKGRRILTMKRGEGLAREEYETPLESGQPTAELAPLREILSDNDAAALAPAFNVRVNRRQRLIRYGEAEIELALDQGEVSGGRRVSPISEVELELKSGRPEALFDLARELAKSAPLFLSFDTKSARGQALVADQTVEARRRGKVRLERGSTAGEAFQKNARSALAAIAANAAALREAPQPEAVHQLRVGARRLRSALSTFRPVVEDGGYGAAKEELRWLARAFDQARNLDVFAAEVVGPAQKMEAPPAGLAALVEAIEAARLGARKDACETAGGERFRRLMIDVACWVETGDWLAGQAAKQPAGDFAEHTLSRRLKKLLKRGRKLETADDKARHKMRIGAKKLRYAGEGFASLYSDKKVDRFVGRLKDLQDGLGALNDIATAEPLIASLNLCPEAAYAAGELEGLKRADREKLIAQAAKAMDRLGDAAPFWE